MSPFIAISLAILGIAFVLFLVFIWATCRAAARADDDARAWMQMDDDLQRALHSAWARAQSTR